MRMEATDLRWEAFVAEQMTWLPPIPERHGIYLGDDRVLGFDYGDNLTWNQRSDLVEVAEMDFRAFKGDRKPYLRKRSLDRRRDSKLRNAAPIVPRIVISAHL